MTYCKNIHSNNKYSVLDLYSYLLLNFGSVILKINQYRMYHLSLDYIKQVYYIGIVDITSCIDYAKYRKIYRLLYGF